MTEFQSTILKDFKPEEYFYFGLWKQDLFSACFWVSSWNSGQIEKLGIRGNELASCVLGKGNFFVKRKELDYIDTQITAKIIANDEAFFERMAAVAKNLYLEKIEEARNYKNYEINSENYWRFVLNARAINLYWMFAAEQFVVTAERALQDAVVKFNFPAEKVPGLIPVIKTPLYYQHQEVLLIKQKIGHKTWVEIKNNLELYDLFVQHTERYPSIEIANFRGNRLTPERLFDLINHLKPEEGIKPELKNVPEDLNIKARIMGYCGYIKQAGAEYFGIHSELAMPFLKSIADKLEISYDEFLFLRDTEILDALQFKISTDDLKNRAEKRKNHDYVIFAGAGSVVHFCDTPDDIKHLKEKMLPVISDKVTEIKGQTGNRGKYSGPVRIIMNTEDFSKMKIGDVLVSTMTTPDFVVLMHKAGAIVTDIGGLLCHAAIVSREIDKPCVIGTKIATKVLKDGDMVEVDAENGIIKMIIN